MQALLGASLTSQYFRLHVLCCSPHRLAMSSFTVSKAPKAAVKPLAGLKRSAAKAVKVTQVQKAKEMMVWTPDNNKCASC